MEEHTKGQIETKKHSEEKHKESKEELEHPREIKVEKEKKSILMTVKEFYNSQYKLLLIIPFILLAFSLVSIGLKYASTGDFINRDVSLKGGVTLTITTTEKIDINEIENILKNKFIENDIEVRALTKLGAQAGIIVAVDIEEGESDSLLEEIQRITGIELTKENYTVEIVGSSLGASFFREVVVALMIAFIFMGIVVFLYFRNFIPSTAVILAAFSDIVVTLAIVNFLNIKLSTAGIAAFLMLIGYSVDTDILLSTRVLKRKDGTVSERIFGALKTGMTMTVTTLAAIIVALVFTQSETIRQIMVILLIGLFVDIINTWIQNVGIIRLYLERKQKIK
ncbi:protein translocase subunit SecF [Candidatus Woesearchaeota archaeon]|nr:protein translocase subunit SecF [Candidatus Woesearchaeota archaeon]